MPPSHVRQEEAELRKIAKQARATRKEQQQKERRRVQRERRAAQKGEDPTAANSSSLSSTQRQRRKSIIVLPEEVEELKQRLHLADSGAESATTPSKQTGKGKNNKKSNKKGEEAAPVSAAAAATSAYPEPNYRIELHFKNKQILVDVDLHRVPPSKINVTGTTAYSLHVDTLQHTKKYQLDLPLPEQLVIDPKTATYEYREQTGVLHCALPIVNEELPAGLQAQWDGMVDSIRKQKALRFTVSKEGDLAVRTRQALLPQRTVAAATEGGAKKRGREAEAKEEEEEEEEEEVKTPTKGKAAAAAADAKAPKAKKSKKEQQEEKKEAKPATKKEKEHLLDERARAQAAAEAAGAKAQLSLKERVQQAKQVQQQRQTQLTQQQGRRQEKLKRQQQSFERVLAEQKAQLLAHAELQVATEVEEKRREAAKLQKQQEAGGKGAKTKKVSFA